MDISPGTDIDGRYVVEELLGQGGMAKVYRVRHVQLDTLYALKVLTISSASIRDRMLQEGRVQAALRHPNIVSVVDVVTVDGALGLVMEYISGPPLDVVLQRPGFTLAQAEALFRDIVSGVAAAHAKGLIHRDLKPANVLIQLTEHGPVPKVTDFGLAKLLTPADATLRRTRSGISMGTPGYMAPEQIRDSGSVDERADIFSLGAILYELCCGQRAFDGADMMDLFTAVCEGRYTPPHEHAPKLLKRVERAIVGALEVKREDRFQSCEALIFELNGGRSVAPGVPQGLWDADTMRELQGLGGADDVSRIFGDSPASQQTEETWEHDLSRILQEHRDVYPSPKAARAATVTTGAAAARQDEPTTLAPSRASTRRWLGLGLAAALGGAALVALGALALVVGLYWRAPEPSPPHAPAAVVQPAPAPPPVVVVPVDSVPDVLAPAAPAPAPPPTLVPRPVASSAVAPAPLAESPPVAQVIPPTPAPTSAPAVSPPPGTGRVELLGDADRVFFLGEAGQFTARDDIPVGSYAVHAVFSGAPPVRVGEAVVREGQRTRVKCVSALSVCR